MRKNAHLHVHFLNMEIHGGKTPQKPTACFQLLAKKKKCVNMSKKRRKIGPFFAKAKYVKPALLYHLLFPYTAVIITDNDDLQL